MRPHRLFNYLIATLGVVLMLITGCSRNVDLSGATTETTNGIMGLVCNDNNTPSQNTVVKLFPADYNPLADGSLDPDYIDTTDAKGKFSFKHVSHGRYSIIARNRDSLTSLRIGSVPVSDDSVTMIPVANLDKPGSISTRFISSDLVDTNSYLYIPGTDIYSIVKNDGSVVLGEVPAGMVSTVILTTPSGEEYSILQNEIVIAPGETVSITNPLWKYSREILLNTTPTGAGVNDNIKNFPVLIRLNSGNFDFSQARNDGADIMFTKENRISLPFEIERWDATANRAEIWVTVDTVFGNNSSQSISMCWGNSMTSSQSIKGGVFDTANGYQGVWHLGDAAGDSVRDATVNRYCGVSPDVNSPSIGEGIIGSCRVFKGSEYITMPNTANSKLNFSESGNYSVSAWVYLDTTDGLSHCIVSKGYEQYYLRSTYVSMSVSTMSPLWEFVEFSETVKWQASNTSASVKQWVMLAGVRQGSTQLLYCNGVLVDSTVDVWNNAVSRNTTNDLTIGSFAKAVTIPISEGYCYFNGGIDEVRILNTAQSADWVKLCFMNQRSDDRLVVFK
jgi:hypothetical protein